jgi:hypothetical protein
MPDSPSDIRFPSSGVSPPAGAAIRASVTPTGLGPLPTTRHVEGANSLCVPKTRSEGSSSQFVLMDQASKSVVWSKAARVNSAHWGRFCLLLSERWPRERRREVLEGLDLKRQTGGYAWLTVCSTDGAAMHRATAEAGARGHRMQAARRRVPSRTFQVLGQGEAFNDRDFRRAGLAPRDSLSPCRTAPGRRRRLGWYGHPGHPASRARSFRRVRPALRAPVGTGPVPVASWLLERRGPLHIAHPYATPAARGSGYFHCAGERRALRGLVARLPSAVQAPRTGRRHLASVTVRIGIWTLTPSPPNSTGLLRPTSRTYVTPVHLRPKGLGTEN